MFPGSVSRSGGFAAGHKQGSMVSMHKLVLLGVCASVLVLVPFWWTLLLDTLSTARVSVSALSDGNAAKSAVFHGHELSDERTKTQLVASAPLLDDDSAVDRFVFPPGSLELPRLDVLKMCRLQPGRFRVSTGNLCTFSEQYKLLFYMLPKSGSSTGRHVMKYSFASEELAHRSCLSKWDRSEVLRTVSVRNPLSRFYASYDEAFVRRLADQESIPVQYRRFQEPFWGWTYKQYSALFDTEEGVKQLTDAFEAFVEDYDGAKVFDTHLHLQVPQMWDESKNQVLDFDLLFDTHNMEEGLGEIAGRVGAPAPEVIRGRAYPRRFNVSALSDATLQKICQLAAIDFCCLNYPLPPACELTSIPHGKRVMCEWTHDARGSKRIQDILV